MRPQPHHRPPPQPTSHARPGLALRVATADDGEQIWRWNNEPAIRRMSLDPTPIPRPVHDAWMTARLADRDHHMWIVEIIGEPIGVVRVARTDGAGAGLVSIALDRTARGLGLGRAALALACRLDGGPLIAEILADNRSSRTCFEACGFVLTGAPRASGSRQILTYEWSNAHAIAI